MEDGREVKFMSRPLMDRKLFAVTWYLSQIGVKEDDPGQLEVGFRIR